MSDKIRKYVLPNLPYLFVFWFFSKIGTAYRIAPGTDFGTKLMGMLDTFPKAFETYWPGLGGIDLLVGLAGAAGVYLLIQSKIRQAKKFRRAPALRVWRGRTKNCKLLLICTAKRLIFRYFAGTKYSPWGLRTRHM